MMHGHLCKNLHFHNKKYIYLLYCMLEKIMRIQINTKVHHCDTFKSVLKTYYSLITDGRIDKLEM